MTAAARTPIPQKVLMLCLVAEEILQPADEVYKIMLAVWYATNCKTPTAKLNCSFSQLHRQHPRAFQSLRAWLASDETFHFVKKSGAYQSWFCWCVACDRLLRGDKASAAFGIGATGRPTARGFTRYEDASLLAEYRSRFVRSETATLSVLNSINGAQLDRSELLKHRKKVRSRKLSHEELRRHTLAIKHKYRMS